MTRTILRPRQDRTDADLRSRILHATEQLLLDTADERKVSISAITRAVGCTPPSVYYYWPDKDALLREVCQRRFAEFTASQDAAAAGIADPVDALRARGLAYFDYGLAHPEPYRVLFMQRAPEGFSGAGHGPRGRSTGADQGAPERPARAGGNAPEPLLRDSRGVPEPPVGGGYSVPELPAAAGQSLQDLVATVQACMDAGRFARHDALTVAVALWSIVHGATSLAVSNPQVPRPFLRNAIELAIDAACRGLAEASVDQ